eukprot:7808806-Karenia_brevis.AAC.1
MAVQNYIQVTQALQTWSQNIMTIQDRMRAPVQLYFTLVTLLNTGMKAPQSDHFHSSNNCGI